MAINPGIPIPTAIPRVSLEWPFNSEDEDVGGCMVDNVVTEDAKLEKVDAAVADES